MLLYLGASCLGFLSNNKTARFSFNNKVSNEVAEHSLSRKALSCYCICQHLYHGGYDRTQGKRLSKNATISWESCRELSVEIFSAFLPSTYHVISARSSVTSIRINPLTPETFLRFRVRFPMDRITWLRIWGYHRKCCCSKALNDRVSWKRHSDVVILLCWAIITAEVWLAGDFW